MSLAFWLPALTLNCMSSPTVVVARSGPVGFPFSAPNLTQSLLHQHASGPIPPIKDRHSLGPLLPLGYSVANFPDLGPSLHLPRNLDFLVLLVVSPLGDGDGPIRVVDLGRGGKSDAWDRYERGRSQDCSSAIWNWVNATHALRCHRHRPSW
jgi:hypothetical protein